MTEQFIAIVLVLMFFVLGFDEGEAATVVEQFGTEVGQAVLGFLGLFRDQFLLRAARIVV